MELTKKQKQVQEVLAKVLEEAWSNEAFKKELVAAPLVAIKKLTNTELHFKEGTKIVVTDQSEPNTFYFNITAEPNTGDVELNEEQLDMVAGGGIEWRKWGILAPSVALAEWIIGE